MSSGTTLKQSLLSPKASIGSGSDTCGGNSQNSFIHFWKGIGFQLLSSTFNFFTFASFKYANYATGVPNSEILTIRGYTTLLLCTYLCYHESADFSVLKTHKLPLLGRALFGFGSQFCMSLGLILLNFSMATTVFNVNPIIGVLLGAIIFKERISPLQIFALIITFLGVLLLLTPCLLTFGYCQQQQFDINLLVPLIAAFCRAGAMVCVRFCKDIHWALPTLVFAFPFCIICPVILVAKGEYIQIPWTIWLVLVVGSACGTFSNIFNTKSLQIAEMGLNTPLCYIVVILSSISDVMWGVDIYWNQWVGAVVIFGGIVCVTYVKYQHHLEKEKDMRREDSRLRLA